MTTKYPRMVVCGNCGVEHQRYVIGSTSTFGPSDLDTRPAPLARYIQEDLIDYCPKCMYGAHNIEDIDSEVKEIVNSDDYKLFISSLPNHAPLRGYVGNAYIKERTENYESAFFSWLQGSWIYGDRGYGSNNLCTVKLLELYENNLTESLNNVVHLVYLDLLRRTGNFEKAKEKALIIKDKKYRFLSPFEADILDFQIKLIDSKDAKVHNCGEVNK